MLKLAGSLVAALLAVSPSLAADLSTRPVYKAPIEASASWTGWYLGGHAGYRWTSADSDTFSVVTGALLNSGNTEVNGPAVGMRAGYNHTINANWMVGLAADVARNWLNDDRVISNTAGTNVHTVNAKTDWSWAVLGRSGYTSGNWLLYVTGGWEWSHTKSTRNQIVGTVGLATPGTIETFSLVRHGWTLGGGAEVALNRNWSAYAEYRFTNYLTDRNIGFPLTLQTSNVRSHANTVQAGVNYRF